MLKAVIFDLCGPLIKIDVNLIDKKLHALGVKSATGYHDLHDAGLIKLYDAGLIAPEEFALRARTILGQELTDEALWTAWNVVVTDFDVRHVATLQRLRARGIKTFLLSNSDVVNAGYFCDFMNDRAGFDFCKECFDALFFSYQLGCRKPDKEIFDKALERIGLEAAEVLFVDDSRKNCAAAELLGLQTHYLADGEEIEDIELLQV